MANRIFTRCVGIIYLLLGACAFVPMLNGGPSPDQPTAGHVMIHFENLFGQMPMNYVLGAVLIGFGAAGIASSFVFNASRTFERILFTSALGLMFLGLWPAPISTVCGLMPLFGWTTGFFLITALMTFYFAFFDGTLSTAMTRPLFRQ